MENQPKINRAFYGDIHGCINELKELHKKVERLYPGIEHWHLGDLVDRGPSSGECIDYVMNNFHGGIMGNHESSILDYWFSNERRIAKGQESKEHPNPDKRRTISQLDKTKVNYLKSLPHLHTFDDVGLVIVHGGLLPDRSLYQQPPQITMRLQMFKVDEGKIKNRWWGTDANKHSDKKTEAESIAEGFQRWYEAYNYNYDCIYGHSVLGLKPFIHQNEGFGKTISIDTGSCFGGYLTAFIYPEMSWVQVSCKEYVEGKSIKKFKLLEKEGK